MSYTAPKPLTFATDASAAKSHGISVKTGHIEWSSTDDVETRQRVGVRLTTHNKGQSYRLEVAFPKVYKQIGLLQRTGAGRNLGYQFYADGRPHHPYHEFGALAPAVERFVRSWLGTQVWTSKNEREIAFIKQTLPYTFDNLDAALDFAYSKGFGFPVVAEHRNHEHATVYYAGLFEHAAVATDITRSLREQVEHGGVKVFGRIDHRAVISRLNDLGVKANTNSDGTEAQVYIDNHSGAILLDKISNDIAAVTWDRTGGVQTESEVAQAVKTVEDAVKAIHRWYASYDLQQRAQSLLEHLQTEVPSGVAHYAVEQAKTALRTLSREAFSVDFTYGRDYTGVQV